MSQRVLTHPHLKERIYFSCIYFSNDAEASTSQKVLKHPRPKERIYFSCIYFSTVLKHVSTSHASTYHASTSHTSTCIHISAFRVHLGLRPKVREGAPPASSHWDVGPILLRPPRHRGTRILPPEPLDEPAVPRLLGETQAKKPAVRHPRVGGGGVWEEQPVQSSRQVVMRQC